MEIAGTRIWVTGASGGIGAALTRELADRGASVAISAPTAPPSPSIWRST